jgi:hypothetical protein
MLTIFTTCKPFKGHSGIIQRNAIQSWTLLRPKPQIILFGSEEGYSEIAAELHLTQVADVQRTERGTPLLSSMFGLAHKLSSNPLLCYLNADIMLTAQFMEALRIVSAAKPKFLMVGRRTLLDVKECWNFDSARWENELLSYAASEGKLDKWVAIDYFAFPRGIYSEIPPFIVGRARWDNWMIYSARKRGIPVIEATYDVVAVHQNHDYGHLARGVDDCFTGPEGLRNQELYKLETCISIFDSTHQLKNGKLRRTLQWDHISRRLDTWPLFSPVLGLLAWPLRKLHGIAKLLLRSSSWKPSADES